jgi:phage/plasmid-like protein (TIGR03299 family)
MAVEEAFRLTLDWRVIETPLYYANPVTGEAVKVHTSKALVRSSNGKDLAVVGASYSVFQNQEHCSFLQHLLGPDGTVEEAGELAGGKKIWLLCRLKGQIEVGSERLDKYVLSVTSHDGSMSHSIIPLVMRRSSQSCWEANLSGQPDVKIRHTSRMDQMVIEAAKTARLTDQRFQQVEAECHKLAGDRFSTSQMAEIADRLFPETPLMKSGKMDHQNLHISDRNQAARDALLHLYKDGHGQHHHPGSRWAALGAVTEYACHHRPTRVANGSRDERAVRDTRLQSVWFGASRKLIRKARELIQPKRTP